MHYRCTTMAMVTSQVRLTRELTQAIDSMVKKGLYANKSDVIRDAVRRLAFNMDSLIGIIPNTGDSVKEVREIRKKLSKEIKSFEDLKKIDKEMLKLLK